MNPVEQKLRTFFTENFFVEDADLSLDASLTRSGVIDSTGVMEIILFLEQEFGLKVADEEVVPENLDTLRALVRFVTSAQREASA